MITKILCFTQRIFLNFQSKIQSKISQLKFLSHFKSLNYCLILKALEKMKNLEEFGKWVLTISNDSNDTEVLIKNASFKYDSKKFHNNFHDYVNPILSGYFFVSVLIYVFLNVFYSPSLACINFFPIYWVKKNFFESSDNF